jgi:Asp-tRNA(Asn)/Glu-tRNA(Gln) amidotransferase A subunit family amidase
MGVTFQPAAWLAMTFPLNLMAQPAATAPAGWMKDGLAVSLQTVGRLLDDSSVLCA